MNRNDAAFAALDAQIGRVQSLPLELPRVAQLAALEVRRIIAANIANGRAPDGTPWPATQDGRPALRDAMRSIDVRAVGSSIVISVDGVEARHHLGAVKGGVRRELIPSNRIPGPVADALARVVEQVLAQHMAGGAT